MTWKVYFKPWSTGTRYIIALMNCEELPEVTFDLLIPEPLALYTVTFNPIKL
jgi:hypothetical protein